MNDDGSGPLSAPIRIAAAVLGAALSVGGAVMIVGGIMSFPRLWMNLVRGRRRATLRRPIHPSCDQQVESCVARLRSSSVRPTKRLKLPAPAL